MVDHHMFRARTFESIFGAPPLVLLETEDYSYAKFFLADLAAACHSEHACIMHEHRVAVATEGWYAFVCTL